MEVKIFCPCGSKYKFDVEPLDGKLPGPVRCPVCGADGTELGNAVVAKNLQAGPSVSSASAVPAAASGAMRIPANAAGAGGQASAASAPVSATSRSGFVSPVVPRSSKEHQAATSTTVAASVAQPPAAAPAVANPLVPTPGSAKKISVAAIHAPAPAAVAQPAEPAVPTTQARSGGAPRAQAKMEAEPSFARGLVGIGVSSFVGLIIWFAFTLFIGLGSRWIGIGLGAMIGWTAAKFAKEQSQRLGIAASVATALVMILGVLWSARHEAFYLANEALAQMWTDRVEYAKGAVQASQSDDQLRKFLAENGSSRAGDDSDDEGLIRKVRAETTGAVDDKGLANFRQKELPELRKIAEGKVSRLQFERQQRPVIEETLTFAFIVVRAFRLKMLVMIAVSVGAAWKLTSGK